VPAAIVSAALIGVALAGGPTAGQSPDPSPSGPLQSLGASTLVLQEAFDDETAWGTTDGPSGAIRYDEGALRAILAPGGNALWSFLPVGTSAPVLGVDALLDLGAGEGIAGPACGATTSGEPAFHFGAVSPQGWVVVGSMVDRQVHEIVRVALPAALDPRGPDGIRVRVECAVTPGGLDRIGVWVDGMPVADVFAPGSIGPFDAAAVIAANREDRWAASFDELAASTGPTYAPVGAGAAADPAPTDAPLITPPPLPSGLATPLIEQVPGSFRDACQVIPPDLDRGQVDAVLCTPAGDADGAEYYRYEDEASLERGFAEFLTRNGASPTGTDCSVGPSLIDYTVGGSPAGQLACYPAPRDSGVLFQWSNRPLRVLAFGLETSGDYAALFRWWQDAGPIP
jgi:hypothetical protein